MQFKTKCENIMAEQMKFLFLSRGGDLVQKYVPENGMDMKIHP